MSVPETDADSRGQPAPLLAAGRLLAERGVYSLVWFNADLVVTARYGRLTEFVEAGDRLAERCIALIGLEQTILALADAPGSVLELPGVALIGADGEAPRLNLTFFHDAATAGFLMLVARATSPYDIEGELSRQMRARLIAEAELAAKSRELTRINTELERANRDLEDFAAVISHDLKAPLRALRFAAEDMARLLDGGDVEQARARLGDIAARSRRMSEMMTALLEYASVGRKADIAAPCATRDLIARVVAAMPVPAGFEIAIEGDWPQIVTVPAALDLVLRNLIDNALKHHDGSAGRITVSARPTERGLTIAVADDGPGIAPAFHRAVLLPFRTLPTSDTPAARARLAGDGTGTGMGLAFVNRAVEAMGGTLAIRSDPAVRRGTTFVLEWPLTVA